MSIANERSALTGNNATLVASGSFGLDGPFGIEGASIKGPSFSVKKSIIDSITGITLGPSGVVAAVKTEVQAGLGVPAASAGPFGSVTVSAGVTNGSSLGAPLARCKGATLDIDVSGGVSVSLSDTTKNLLEAILPPGTDVEKRAEASLNVLHREQVVPDVPLCQGGG